MQRKNQWGVTLIELTILMAVAGILAMIVMPDIITSLQTLRLNNAAQKLAMDIRYARSLALSHHSTYGIDFDLDNDNAVDGDGYSVFQLVSGTQTTITDPHRNGSMIMDYNSMPEYAGVTITSAGSVQIRIDSFGKPYNASGTALSSALTINLQVGSLTRSVRVTQQTAFVEFV